ncbi:MAG: exodeoxyribonuclease III, partial [Oscillospiraceae bacterium]|nr:exodeoxyribonuclease III [Oscillospiraceae bacterium]
MKLISWNVNGFRANLSKGFEAHFRAFDADLFCIQETKMQPEQVTTKFDGWHQYFNSAVKKGYSGTALFAKQEPLELTFNFGNHMTEGRTIIAEYEKFILINIYVPNSQRALTRLDYRMQWEDDFRNLLLKLDQKKPLIICGDMNVAHQEIDLKNPKSNIGNAGFTDQERGKFTELLKAGFTDSFRYLHPSQEGAYTWWSYMYQARTRNVGWRIDYFLVSDRIADRIAKAEIYPSVMGSDHCPVGLEKI